ncbi:phage holin family protein [Flavobacterium sp.]|uniref:phage holin family protein n=1 Tax=Flavobacterium sp. TaxID=239 RepID=UPI00352874E7
MGLLLRILITAGLVMLISHLLPGVKVDSFVQSIYVAIILGLLNLFIKPLIILFTLPVTILTLGFFLLVINAFIVLLCSNIVGGFHVESFWTALFFSIILSVFQSVVYKLTAAHEK